MGDLISVIVPIYNVEKYLTQCIESIINQTYKNLEIILVDDGSKDNSGKICDEYQKKDSRIKVIHKENGGTSSARNEGLEISTGKYIQFVDSDDYIDLDMIEFLYKILKEENADISMCSYYKLNKDKFTTNATEEKINYTSDEALQELLLDTKIRCYVCNKLIDRKCIENIRFPVGRTFEDIITLTKIFTKADKLILVDKPKYYYRQRKGSILNNQTNELRLSYIQAVLETTQLILKEKPYLKNYCDYNIVHAGINTFNDIRRFNMNSLLEDKKVKDLHKKMKKIMGVKECEDFIVHNCSQVKKMHLYYILSNLNSYIKNDNLPLLHP